MESSNRDLTRKVEALRDILSVAADAFSKRSLDEVLALESLCDSFVRQYGDREDKPSDLQLAIRSLGISEKEAIRRIVR